MKKIKEPNLKVIKFESMDVIATSDQTSMDAKYVSLEGLTWESVWH